MTRRRWIADEVAGNSAALIGNHAHHLAQVLRAQVGQQFEVSASGEVRLATVTSVRPDRVEFELGDPILYLPGAEITVVISIFKFDRMEWAIEKCTELGVATIIPVVAARTGKHLASAAGKRVERWRRIANEASEQSRRRSSPPVAEPIPLKQFFSASSETGIVLSEIEEKLLLKDAVPDTASSLTLAFGPEGGWKEQELDAFRESGWTLASLGPQILRAETAIIAAVAIASAIVVSR